MSLLGARRSQAPAHGPDPPVSLARTRACPFLHSGLFIIDDKGILRQSTINDRPGTTSLRPEALGRAGHTKHALLSQLIPCAPIPTRQSAAPWTRRCAWCRRSSLRTSTARSAPSTGSRDKTRWCPTPRTRRSGLPRTRHGRATMAPLGLNSTLAPATGHYTLRRRVFGILRQGVNVAGTSWRRHRGGERRSQRWDAPNEAALHAHQKI